MPAHGATHQPCFTFRTHGGETAGGQWIYDHDEPIAMLEHRTIDQPEQELRYFDGNPRPVNLRYLKLAPGTRPLVAGVQMFWVFQHRVLATTELVDVAVEGHGSDRLRMAVVTRDPGGVATSRRAMELTYDPARATYVYDFAAHLDIHSPELFDAHEKVAFEYCDPWYMDTPGPSVPFEGMWPKRYTHLVAELADGTVWQMPLNHMVSAGGVEGALPAPAAMRPDGRFVAALDPGHNPAFQFVGETGPRTSIGVCHWGYDVHFVGHFTRDELWSPVCPRFRILLCPDDEARGLLERATSLPRVTYNGFEELPMYERQTSFARGMHLSKPTPGDTDPWPWLPRGDGHRWERAFGRSDACSLAIRKDTPGASEWFMEREGRGMFTPLWRSCHGLRVTGYMKTENVVGRGSSIALEWGRCNAPERYPYVSSARMVGTNDWTRVTVELRGPNPPDSNAIYIILRQDGAGTTWFDDLEVVPLASAGAKGATP